MAYVFIGMETSGQLRRRFQALGHWVVSVDTLPSDDNALHPTQAKNGGHWAGDVFATFELLTKTHGIAFDLGIFHPTCTFHTVSAAWAFKDPDFDRYPGVGYHQKVKAGTLTGQARHEARALAEADVKRIWALPIKRKAIENPIGTLSKRWQKPTQIINPFEFGDDASKATCLWLDELPELKPTGYCEPRMICNKCGGRSDYGVKYCTHCYHDLLRPRWANQTDTGQNNIGPSADRWKERSKTYPGPADAMAAQWGHLF